MDSLSYSLKIRDRLQIFVVEHQSIWDLDTQLLTFVYNMPTEGKTNLLPFAVVLSQETLPTETFDRLTGIASDVPAHTPTHNWKKKLRNDIAGIQKTASRRLTAALQQYQQDHYTSVQ